MILETQNVCGGFGSPKQYFGHVCESRLGELLETERG